MLPTTDTIAALLAAAAGVSEAVAADALAAFQGSLLELSRASENSPLLVAACRTTLWRRRLIAAAALAAAAQRSACGEVQDLGTSARASSDIAKRLAWMREEKQQEVFVMLSLDSRHRILREREVFRGGLANCPVDPRTVLRFALQDGAAALIVAHNHPSGDPTASPADHEITRRLQRACETMGIPLVDHVVLGSTSHVSFLDQGWL